jgi:REP element-mobilizing transposase RayT
MRLNDAGRVVQAVWNEIPDHYPGVTVDAFIVMPDHMHGIVVLVGTGPRACPESEPISIHGQARGPAPTLSLPDVVNRYKTMTTKRYTDGVKNQQWAPFPGRLWQRNYYEHIIQNEHALNLIRRYIRNNPAKWAADRLARAAEQTSVR